MGKRRKKQQLTASPPSKKTVRKYAFWGIVSLLAGGALALLKYLTPNLPRELINAGLYVGIVFLVIGVLALFVSFADKKRLKKQQAREDAMSAPAPASTSANSVASQPQYQTPDRLNSTISDRKPKAYPSAQPKEKRKKKKGNAPVQEEVKTVTATLEGNQDVQYVGADHAYEFITMGSRQSTEEKFNEIAKMDQTQFVIYIARLFSRKGFQVKFTPVMDNYGIDLLVEKMGETIAVGCLLTSKVLCGEDVMRVHEGSRYYQVTRSMALTNMYFDRTALDCSKKEKVTLVDRNILIEDYMN